MKKIFICLLSGMLLCASGCRKSTSSETEAITKQFLTLIYTTDENERYTEFVQNIDVSDEDSITECTEAYYADIKDLVDTEYLNTMTANRIPMKYDELYHDDHVTVDDIALDESDGKYDFTVNAHYGSGDLTFTGTVGFSDDQKINYFYDTKK